MEYKWIQTVYGSMRWDDYTNSDPIYEIAAAVQTIEKECEKAANYCIIGGEVWKMLKWHPVILSALRDSHIKPSIFITRTKMAKLFGFRRVIQIDELGSDCVIFYCKEYLKKDVCLDSLAICAYKIKQS